MQSPQLLPRKRTNVMLASELLEQLDALVPERARSDFINEAIEQALIHWSRKKAVELIHATGKKRKAKSKPVSTSEILKILRRDRRF